jgi:Skp family chaperone for outer membrane proteins
MSESLEPRFSKIDDAIQRLASVASDLSKMLAVHEHRITQQEKESDSILKMLEDHRKEYEVELEKIYNKYEVELEKIYNKIDDKDNKFISKIEESVSKSNTKINETIKRIESLEKLVWIVSGAGIILGFMFSNLSKLMPVISLIGH